MFVKIYKHVFGKNNLIYYYIAQKFNRVDRQEHRTADKGRGKGWTHA